tara:strand:- start:24537 stop:24920 length:384 start_codon:yes stop_codon:yes gene_type:complete
MYLKIRDVERGCWLYISGFDRVEAFDKKHYSELSHAPDQSEACERMDTIIQECGASLSVIDVDKIRSGNLMVLHCITDDEDAPKPTHKKLAFNTYGFLCNDRGDTMDRFSVNHYDHLKKSPRKREEA